MLQTPFPWFGGKSRVAADVWSRFGDVPNYVEPFGGSLAVLLRRPHEPKIETVNDADAFICNFWRAVRADPDGVAHYADWPVNESDLHARHLWLVNEGRDRVARLESDPDFCDVKVAGWWLWGICCWIGSGWCSGVGPWRSVDGKLSNQGPFRRLHPHQGVSRKVPHLGDAGQGINRKRPNLTHVGKGINRQLVHLGSGGKGINRQRPEDRRQFIIEWMRQLCSRLRDVRVCCGDWTRALGPSPTIHNGLTGVLLDPPYSQDERDGQLYRLDSDVADDVRKWAVANGDNPMFRIALCGYEGEHEMPASWECLAWKARGGYGNQNGGATNVNSARERIWFSPACLRADGQGQLSLFET